MCIGHLPARMVVTMEGAIEQEQSRMEEGGRRLYESSNVWTRWCHGTEICKREEP